RPRRLLRRGGRERRRPLVRRRLAARGARRRGGGCGREARGRPPRREARSRRPARHGARGRASGAAADGGGRVLRLPARRARGHGGERPCPRNGGGAGMVLRVDVVTAALEAVYGGRPPHRVVALTPTGRALDQALVEELAGQERLTLLSSRFEGFDERIVEHLATDAVSIGPYVLSNGDLAAMVLLDAVTRRLPGALAEGSGELESFSEALGGGLEYPHYTRPAEFRGW